MSPELTWHKSSYSDTEGGACIEVGACPSSQKIHIRDSKDTSRDGPILTCGKPEWKTFIAHATAI